jgi:hypothetical protein
MKATELRVGNLVTPDLDDTNIFNGIVVSVGWGEIKDSQILANKWKYKPIPLTDEWLKRLGFELGNYSYQDHYKIDGFMFACRMSKTGLVCSTTNESIKIYHVHQLQNLYYALTGEELTLQEPVEA